MDAAIIGGSGVGDRLRALGGVPFRTETRFGPLSGRLLDRNGRRVLLVSRHAFGHKTPPHLVSFRAFATGLRDLGAEVCLSTAAVGSLNPSLGPGEFLAPRDLLDRTGRPPTIFERTVVHTDMSAPFHPAARAVLLGEDVHDGGVYLGVEGPRYETPREIVTFRAWGADVVGMTASTEAIAFREAGVPYACLCIVTNLAAGLADGPLDHHLDVVPMMDRAGERAVALLLNGLDRFFAR